MPPRFNTARLSVEVGGFDLPALALSGTEGLSQPFRYILDILAPPGFYAAELLDLPARITLTGCDGCARTITGIVTALEQQNPHPDGRGCFRLTVESTLARLRLQHDTRIFLHQSVPQIIETILAAHGIAEDRLCLRLSRHYPVRPWTLQVNESDFEFISRLLAKDGIFYWSEADADGELLCLSDHNAQLPERPGTPLQYRPGGGMEPESCGIRALQVRRRLVADLFEVQQKSRLQPSQALRAQAGLGKDARLRHYRYAAGADHLDEAQYLARIAAEKSNTHSFELYAQADVADLSAGQVLSLDAARLSSHYSGDHLVSALRLRMSQRAGEQAAGGDLALQCVATLVPRETQWRPPQPPRPEIPFTFSARIESTSLGVQLDEQGRTQARTHFDCSARAHGEASIALRRLSPHGGPPADLPYGLHAPLHEGAEVLMSCLNGDPDLPILVGAVPNPATASPVSSANRSRNIWRSAADNQLLMDDAREQEVITLSTFAGDNILELNARALGNRIRLASEQGAASLQARKTQRFQCGETLTEHSGNDRSHTIEQHQRTGTRSAEIHHQAHTDHQHRATQNLKLDAGRNLEMTSAGRLRFDLQRGQKLTVNGPEATFSVRDGEITIQAAQDIEIQGQGGGDIRFGQSGGGFVVTAGGNVRIFGNRVSFGGQGGASLNGPVNYQIGAAEPMPGVEACRALNAQGIVALRDQNSPAIVNLAWERQFVPVGEAVDLFFTVKNFQGGETARVRVFERDAEDSLRQIDALHCLLDDGFGHYRLPWSRSGAQVQEDLLQDANALDPSPLTYLFDVRVGDIHSENSPGLHLTTRLHFTPRDWEGRPLPEGIEYHLVDALGRRHSAQIHQGELCFDEAVVGPWQLLGASDAILFEAQE